MRCSTPPLDQWLFPDRDSDEDLAKQRRFLETDLLIETDATDDNGTPPVGESGKKIRKQLRVRMVVNFSYNRYLKDSHDIDERENKAKSLLRQGPAAIDKIKGSKVEYLKKCGLDANGNSTGKAPSKNDRNTSSTPKPSRSSAKPQATTLSSPIYPRK